MMLAAFVAGSFVASPELRAYAAATVGSAEIIDGSIQSLDIGNGQVKTADLAGSAVNSGKIQDGSVGATDIGTDAVGAAELQGVTKLLFGQCESDSTEGNANIPSGVWGGVSCTISGVDSDDSAIATMNLGNACFAVVKAETNTDVVSVVTKNECSYTTTLGTGAEFGILVFDK
jgi:hypothetical protein